MPRSRATEQAEDDIMCFFAEPRWHWKSTKDKIVVGEIANEVTVTPDRGKERKLLLDVPTEFYKFYHDIVMKAADDGSISNVRFRAVQSLKRWYFLLDYDVRDTGTATIPLWYWIPSNRPRWLAAR